MTDRYPDSTLDEKFKSMVDKMDEQGNVRDNQFEAQNKILGDIKEQTTKTNGRVSSLEGRNQYFLGGLGVFVFLIVPAVGWLFYAFIQYGNTIASIQTELSGITEQLTRLETQK